MKNKWYILLFIVLIAISLFAFQYVAELLSDAPRSLSLETQYLLNLPACIFVGIVDFLIIVIVHKRLDNINNTMRIFIDLLLASVWVSCFGIAANYILSIILEEPWPEDYALLKMSLPVVLWNSMIVLLIEIFFYQQSQMEAEKKLAIIEKEKIQYQYETLKAQINPHFLFNMLNNANVLIKRNPEEASKVLFKLEDLLRYQINDSSRERVSLASDIRFLNDYLNLEKIRRDNFQFTMEEHGETDSIWVQPLLFIPFVENAVKHSFDSEHPSYVHVSFKVDNDRLEFRCENSTPEVAVSKGKVGGIGLVNIQRRLGLLYPGRYELKQIENENKYTVILSITL